MVLVMVTAVLSGGLATRLFIYHVYEFKGVESQVKDEILKMHRLRKLFRNSRFSLDVHQQLNGIRSHSLSKITKTFPVSDTPYSSFRVATSFFLVYTCKFYSARRSELVLFKMFHSAAICV